MNIKNIETGEVRNWTLKEVLEEINRDHSGEFTPYNRNDWREGWNEWCEGEYYTLNTI